MINISFDFAASAMGARWSATRGSGKANFPEVSIDSRTIQLGQCFFAIKGPRTDGHDYIGDAFDRGATALVCSDASACAGIGDVPVLFVDDPTRALQSLARAIRLRWGGPLLAVTGSCGKTTTRSFVAGLLAGTYRVHESPGNLNNEFGVPLSLSGLEDEDEWAVLELGMNRPGEIRFLCELCRPSSALITNVAPVHTEFFNGLDEIADAKAEVLEHLTGDGLFFYNADDSRVSRMADSHGGPTLGFSVHKESDVQLRSPRFKDLDRMKFEICYQSERWQAESRVVGEHQLYNLAAAVAVALTNGVNPGDVLERIRSLEPDSRRGTLLTIGGHSEPMMIWDDSHNSSPSALRAVLSAVCGVSSGHRLVLVLGDMLELGVDSASHHFRLGQEAALQKPGLLVTVGAEARELARGACEAGLDASRIETSIDARSAADYLEERVRPGDFLLVKGSRGVGLEAVIDRIAARFGDEGRPAREPISRLEEPENATC